MLDSWDISHLKGGICSSVWSTKTFLHDIREPRYKQNIMRYQISRIWNDEFIGHLEIWYHRDLFLILLAMNILVGGDTSFLWYVSGSTPFLYNIREPKYKQNNMETSEFKKKYQPISKIWKYDIEFWFIYILVPWYRTEMFLYSRRSYRSHLSNEICLSYLASL